MDRGSKPLVDIQISQDILRKNPLAEKQAMLPIQPIALSSPFIPPQFQTYLNNFMKNFYTPFIYKDYNIKIGGPNADHVLASTLYEDALPPLEVFTSYKTLRERNNLCDYIRGTFIIEQEGELANFTGSGNCLNARLKFIELNPHNSNKYSRNPYKGLPENMLIYSSCYPIVYDKNKNSIQCNKSSVGINMRVYGLSYSELLVIHPKEEILSTLKNCPSDLAAKIKEISGENNSENNSEKKTRIHYNVWREIDYYKFIREVICKRGVSPNFVQSYSYFINVDANITFEKNGLKVKDDNKKSNNNSNSNTALLLLTESPNKSLINWASTDYRIDGKIRKMIYSGYKTEEQWNSIIAQILISFYVMEKNSFYINDMNLYNLFIKDINIFGDTSTCWLYNIDGIDYYIPNYGNLLMIDPIYKDLDNSKKEEYKIMGKFLGDDCGSMLCLLKESAKKIFEINNFIGDIVPPPIHVKDKMNNIVKGIDENKDFKTLIEENLTDYIHNRIGTRLRDLEKAYIIESIGPFKKGEIVIKSVEYDTYEIVLFLKEKNEDLAECFTLIENGTKRTYKKEDISKDLLLKYSQYEKIKPDMRPGEPVTTMDYIIESYKI